MPSMAETSEYLIKKGEELANQNEVTKIEEGQRYFQKAIEIDPHNLKAWFSLAICMNSSDTVQMKKILDQAIDSALNIDKENVNMRLIQDWTPLTVSVYCNNIKACKLLIDKGADVNLAQDSGTSPLDLAACYGLKDIAELLIEHGVDINRKDNKTGWSSLMCAVFYRHYDMVEYLISKGAYTGDYPLFYAVCTGNTDEIKSLLNKRTVNSRAFNNQTPLHFACKKEVAELLFYAGADISAIDDENMTPLHRASLFDYKEVIPFFVEKGSDVNAINVYGSTPLHFAVYNSDKDIVEFLIHNGASVNIKDGIEKTPLDEAKTDEIKEVLIKNGAKTGKEF